MADNITKILFRKGLDVQRRTAGGLGVKFNVAEPAFCIDTKRFYIGTGTDPYGKIGGAPIGNYNLGAFPAIFGNGPSGYNSTTFARLTSTGCEVGDILFDNSTSIMWYVSSKSNPMSAVPATSELAVFSLIGQVSALNGIVANKSLPYAVYKLDPTYFTVGPEITLNQNLNLGSVTTPRTFTLNGSQTISSNLLVNGTGIFNGSLTVNADARATGILYARFGTGGANNNSDAWASTWSTVNSTSGNLIAAQNTLNSLLPFGWVWNTTTRVISTYGNGTYKVGINATNPSVVGLTVNGVNSFTEALVVNGSIKASGDVIAYTTSDAKYKKNVQPIDNALQKIQAINGVTFDWDWAGSSRAGHDVGVIAQEIEKVLPEAVITRESGKAVDYEKIIPLLIQAIKELADK